MTHLIDAGARNVEQFRRRLLFYRSAREGLADLLATLADVPGSRVLLPAFIGWSPREGSGVFAPVVTSGVDHRFYDLADDLTIDLDRLQEALGRFGPKLLLLIHYWGRTEPRLAQVRALADAHGSILVEDLAHGFFSSARGGPAGRTGGVGLYSLHKMFPFADGGMVAYNDVRLIAGQRETAPELARSVLEYDWAAIAEARRSNFLALTDLLSGLPELGRGFSLIWPRLAPDDVPQSLPVRILTGQRDRIYAEMRAEGYGMTSLYHTLIPEVAQFPRMRALSEAVTNFPVHQDVAARDLPGMVEAFRVALRS